MQGRIQDLPLGQGAAGSAADPDWPVLSPTPHSDKITFCCSLGVLKNSGGNQTIFKIVL